jgi:hypothetical protein
VLSKGERTFVAATYDGRNTRVYVNGRSVARLNLRAHGRLTPFLSDSGLPVTAAFLGAVFALGCLGLGGGAAVRRRWAVSTAAGVTAALLFIAAGGVDAFPDVARLLPVYGIFGGIAAAAACRPGVFWSAG